MEASETQQHSQNYMVMTPSQRSKERLWHICTQLKTRISGEILNHQNYERI